MTFLKETLELAASGLIGGFIGYLASYLTTSAGSMPSDIDLSAEEERAVFKLFRSEKYQKEISKSRWVAGIVSGVVIRLILLVL